MSALPAMLAYARHCVSNVGAARTAGRIELALEELFTNSVMHGYGGESDASVWLRIDIAPTTIVLEYTDAAPPYDPLQHTTDLDHDRADRPAGGLGILIARRLSDRAEYRFASGKNVLSLSFDVSA